MARTRSDYKVCKRCKKSLMLGWAKNRNGKWQLANAKVENGSPVRDEKGVILVAVREDGSPDWHECHGLGEEHENPPVETETEPEAEPIEESSTDKPKPKKVSTDALGPFAGMVEWLRSMVSELVADAIAAAKITGYRAAPIIINGEEIKRKESDPPVHVLFPKIMRLILSGKHVFLWGGPGGGKSYLAIQVAEMLRAKGFPNPCFRVMSKDLSLTKIEGYIRPHDGGYQESPEFRAYRDGGIVVLDEASNAPPSVLMLFNALMANAEHTFPGVPEPVKRHPNFRVIMCDNTPGHGGTRGHESRQAIDSSTLNRTCSVEFKYDEKLEDALALGINPQAGDWVAWVRTVRKYLSEQNTTLRVISTPRASIEGASLLANGFSVTECADMLVFQGCGKEARKSILSACPLP